jgi:hypothetical protein
LSICINLGFSDLLLKGILILISFVGSLGLFFGIGSKADAEETKRWVLSLLCFLLAALGTPVAYGIFQLLNKVEIVSILLAVFFTPFTKIFSYYYGGDKVMLQKDFSRHLTSTDGWGVWVMLLIFVAIFGIMTLFINLNMETFMKKKSIKMFIATLITMAVSLFVAYCSLYNGFSHLYTFIKSILEFTIVVPMPLVTILVSLVHVAYSMTNYRKFKRRYNTDK